LFSGGEVTSGAIANGAVNAINIASGAVTDSKLAANSSAALVSSLPLTGVFTGALARERSSEMLKGGCPAAKS
jgi:hypothetical protein